MSNSLHTKASRSGKQFIKSWSTGLLFLVFFDATAQRNAAISPNEGIGVIKGHIMNAQSITFDIMLFGYFGSQIRSVPINSMGDFFCRLKIPGSALDVSFMDVPVAGLFLRNKDTLELDWDARNIPNSIQIKGSAGINQDIPVLERISKVYGDKLPKLHEVLQQRSLADSLKFKAINQVYNEVMQVLFSSPLRFNSQKIAIDIYFRSVRLMMMNHLLSAYDLHLDKYPDLWKFNLLIRPKYYLLESETAYQTSYEYRDFIFDWVRMANDHFFDYSEGGGLSKDRATRISPISSAWKDYYIGQMSFDQLEMRDWFITQSIMLDFARYSSDDAEAIYRDFLTKVKTPKYADTIRKFYAGLKHVMKGALAPEFSLKDENGKLVALKRFKGKTVFIDFWGVSCPPCLSDIKNFVPTLHKKYKRENIVFVNICVDAGISAWKAKIKDLDLHGINLIAPGWTKNATCKKYYVDAIPHYALIDAKGHIITNSAPSPSQAYELYKLIEHHIN